MVDLGEFRQVRRGVANPLGAELQHHIALLNNFARRDIRDPVMRQAAADNIYIAWLETADMVADERHAGRVGDEMDFVVGVDVPGRHFAGIVVVAPEKRLGPDRAARLQLGLAVRRNDAGSTKRRVGLEGLRYCHYRGLLNAIAP